MPAGQKDVFKFIRQLLVDTLHRAVNDPDADPFGLGSDMDDRAIWLDALNIARQICSLGTNKGR